MASIVHLETVSGDGTGFLSGITSLLQVGSTLYSAGRWGGGLGAHSVGTEGLTQRDRQTWAGGTANFAEADLVPLTVNGQLSLLQLTPSATSFNAYQLSSDGLITGVRVTMTVSGGMPDRPLDAAAAAGRLYFAQTDGGIASYTRAPSGALKFLGETGGGAANAVAAAEVAGNPFVIAAETDGDAIAVYRPVAGGLALVDRIGAAEGLGINAPSQLEIVTVGGIQLAVVGAQQSNTVTVLRLADDGTLTATDHITDTLATRFGTMGAFAVAEGAGQAYLAVAGEDGVTVLRLLPTGRLVHVATLADAAGWNLDNVSALALRVVGDDLIVTAASATESGLSSFRVDLSDEGEVVVGAGTGATQAGGVDQDVFLAGAGDDVFRGGGGADTFVFHGDGSQDRVLDYMPGVDRLDLSSVPLLYSVSQLTIVPTATGAAIHFGALAVNLVSANGQPLTATDLQLDTFLQHVAPGNLSGIGRNISGTARADTLAGSSGDDYFRGLDGNDILIAGTGSDKFDGGAGYDVVSYSASGRRVLIDLGDSEAGFKSAFTDGLPAGHSYRDIEEFRGGSLADWMRGDADGNVFLGGGDADRLEGRGGDDRLAGDFGNDVLKGGTGADTLGGGDWSDILVGQAGSDRAFGGSGNDSLFGGAGADTLDGGDWVDILRGQEGSDRVYGGGGNDSLFGGVGRDVLAGGEGADHFVFAGQHESPAGKTLRDVIADFRAGIDWIDLSAIDANPAAAGDQGFSFIGLAAFSGARQVNYFQTDSKTVIRGDIDGDGSADFEIELWGAIDLDTDDFGL